MAQLTKILESETLVRFQDCDPFNHLNNSKYIDYVINAREDQLKKHYDFDIYKIASQQALSWVVVENRTAYVMPANLMEKVIIQTQLIFFNNKIYTVEATMWNEDKTVLKCLMWGTFAYFNLRTKKSETHSDELMIFFKTIENPLDPGVSFEMRLKNLKQKSHL